MVYILCFIIEKERLTNSGSPITAAYFNINVTPNLIADNVP